MVRRRLAIAFVLAAALAAGGSAASSPGLIAQVTAPCEGCTAPTFVVTGRGWGHGVGLSQYGALGFALRGVTYDRILAHYYQGTQLGPAPVRTLRVLLVRGRKSLAVSSKAPFSVQDAVGETHELAAGRHVLGPGLRVRAKGEPKMEQLPGPLLFIPGAQPLALTARPYRGRLLVSVEKGKLRAINVVGLEAYLYGVVPSEMPHRWAPEALKAQAVAARTYALATRRNGEFDVYDDQRSQVYLGIEEEEWQTNAAVDATAGQVVTYQGRVAHTYFFSTSGGRTSAVTDAWPGSKPTPYLVAVDDPYDAISPYHRWGPFVFTAKGVRKQLKLPGRLLDVRTNVNGSGRVRSVSVVTTTGEASVPGGDVRRLLGLRSTWFRVGVLALASPAAPVTFGSQTRLSGVARGLSGVTLEERPAGGGWRPAPARVAPGRDGALAPAVAPRATTLYRLAVGEARSAAVRVAVAPLVRFHPPAGRASLRGLVRPLLPGALVEIQRSQDEVRWARVTRARVDGRGEFEAALALQPGTYRARVAPGRGFAAGMSALLRVPPA